MYPLSVHIWVDDLPASLAFYTGALGFDVRRAGSQRRSAHLQARRGEHEIMLSQAGAFAEEWPLERMALARKTNGAGAMSLYLESPDIEADCKRARDAGALVHEGVVDRPWGQREFVVEDPDGFWLTFWQVTDPAAHGGAPPA